VFRKANDGLKKKPKEPSGSPQGQYEPTFGHSLGWTMRLAMDPFRLLLISLAGWLNQRQQQAIDYLQEETRVLREQL